VTAGAANLTREPATWRALLRRPDYRRIWIGHGLSAFGSHLTLLALPLLVLDVTRSATLAGLIGTVKLLAYALANLPGGALADRLPRRSVLLVADATRASFVLAIALIVATDAHAAVPLLLALTAAESAVSAVSDPAGTAATRHLVAEHQIPTALAFGMAKGNAVALTAPLVGGLLFAVAPPLPFLVDTASYLLSMGLVWRVRGRLGGATGGGSSLVDDIRAGLRYVLRSRFLVQFIGWLALLNAGTAGITFGLVILFGPAHASQLGLVTMLVAAAGMAGAVIASTFSAKLNGSRMARVASLLVVLAAGAAAVRPDPVVLAACVIVFALLGPAIAVPLNTLLFAVVPDELMGRAQSSVFLIASSLYPFADVVSGWLAERYSPGTAFTVFTLLLAAAFGMSLLPGLRGGRVQDEPKPGMAIR